MSAEPLWLQAARRYIGVAEIPGKAENPVIGGWLYGLPSSLSKWLSQCEFWRHLVCIQPLKQSGFLDAIDRLSICKREFTTERTESKRVALVVVLRVARYPSAILRRVVTVIVDTINLMIFRRTFAHVCEEACKSALRAIAAKPSVTDANAAPAVVLISASMRTVTTSFHVRPDPLRRRIRKSVNADARVASSDTRCGITGATSFGLSVSQVISGRATFSAAITASQIADSFFFENGPPAKLLAN